MRNLALQLRKLKFFYLYHHNVYGYQTWKSGDLPWGAPTHKVARPFNHTVLRDQVTNQKCLHYHNTWSHQTRDHDDLEWGVSTHKFTWPSKKLLRGITWKIKNIISLCSQTSNPLITYFCEVTPQIKYVIIYFHGANGHQTWQVGVFPFCKLMTLNFKTLNSLKELY